MLAQVYLHIHHGGNFVRDHKIRYVNGDFEKIEVDPDNISYPHLIKYIKKDRYSNIVDLYYKLCHEGMDQLRLLSDDYSTVVLIEEVSKWGEVEIYVEHGLDDAFIHLELPCVGASKGAGMEDVQHRCNPIDEVGVACDNVCEDTPMAGNVHANNEYSEGRGGDVQVDPGDEDLKDADDKDTEDTSHISQFRNTERGEGGQGSENEDLSSDDVEDGSVYYDSEDPPIMSLKMSKKMQTALTKPTFLSTILSLIHPHWMWGCCLMMETNSRML
ncbi:unnamed protein product [Cuscuta epithymum]|nr:unnamed protein product [Cuscuta epithymum]